MSSRRFRPKSIEDTPFVADPWAYLRLSEELPVPLGDTYGALVNRLYRDATRTATLVEFTPDQADALKAINRTVLGYILDLASWVEKQEEEPALEPVARQLAAYARQARDFEYQYNFDTRDIAGFVQFHAQRYCAQLKHLQRLAADARKLIYKTTTTCRVIVELEMVVPAPPHKIEEHLSAHGCKLYFANEKPSRILSIKPALTRIPKKIKKVKRRKKKQ